MWMGANCVAASSFFSRAVRDELMLAQMRPAVHDAMTDGAGRPPADRLNDAPRISLSACPWELSE